jgi:hypothetical protein
MVARVERQRPILLAQLAVGERLPWRLDEAAERTWLTVVELVGQRSYVVRYPNGASRF